MIDIIIQRVSLIGQVVEDLSYEALSLRSFTAQLVGVRKLPQYKEGGFFVFSDLRPGEYTLYISGDHLQPQKHMVTVPVEPISFDSPPTFDSPPVFDSLPLFDQPGDNELVVIVKTINTINGGSNKITFDQVVLKKEIRKGARVLAPGLATRLAATLDVGMIREARLEHVEGLTTGSIVRLVRERSIRLKFDPYYLFPFVLTSIIGTVVLMDAPQIPPEGAQVRLTQVNGGDVVLNDIVGATVATVSSSGVKIVLGTEKDVVTFTNQRGDYHLYFDQGWLVGNATLEASFPGYHVQAQTITVTENTRNQVDFALIKL